MSRVNPMGSGSAPRKTQILSGVEVGSSSGTVLDQEKIKELLNAKQQELISVQEQVKSVKNQIDSLETNFNKKIEAEIEKVENRLEDIKIRNLESLAIFIGFFTFVSIDFQVIKYAPDWFAATGLICISAGLIIGFLLLLNYLLTGKETEERQGKNRKGWIAIVVFILAVVVLGLVLLRASYLKTPNRINSEDKVVVNNNPVTSGGSVQVSGNIAPTSTPVFPTSSSTTH